MKVTVGRPTCDEGLRPDSDAVADVAHAMVVTGRVVPGLSVGGRAATGRGPSRRIASLVAA